MRQTQDRATFSNSYILVFYALTPAESRFKIHLENIFLLCWYDCRNFPLRSYDNALDTRLIRCVKTTLAVHHLPEI